MESSYQAKLSERLRYMTGCGAKSSIDGQLQAKRVVLPILRVQNRLRYKNSGQSNQHFQQYIWNERRTRLVQFALRKFIRGVAAENGVKNMKFLIVTLALCLPACAQTWFSNVTKTPAINSCTVGWTTAVPAVTHIDYGTVAGVYKKTVAYNTKFSRVKTATISGLLEGTTYHFRIDAGDANKVWVKSPDMYCTTKKKVVASESVHLNWQASNSGGITGYKVYRSTISGGYYALLGSVIGLTYTDQAVQHGITYYYTIKAISKSGLLSSYSNQVKAVIP